MSYIHKHLARRDFLRRTALATAWAGTPFAANLAAIGAAAAQTAGDHKALVCIFLHGGNDNSNTIVPVESSAYSRYLSARPAIAPSGPSSPVPPSTTAPSARPARAASAPRARRARRLTTPPVPTPQSPPPPWAPARSPRWPSPPCRRRPS